MPKDRLRWTAGAESALLDIWEQKMGELRGPRKNSHIYMEMPAELTNLGFPSSAHQIKMKLDNFTSKYRKCKAVIGASGGSPPSWPLFERINRILGSYRIFNFQVEESIQTEYIEEECDDAGVSSPPMEPMESGSSVPEMSGSNPTNGFQGISPMTSSTSSSRAARKKNIDAVLEMGRTMNSTLNLAMEEFRQTNSQLLELEREHLRTFNSLAEAFTQFLRREPNP